MKTIIFTFMLIFCVHFVNAQMNELNNKHPFDQTLVLSVDGGFTLAQTDYRSVKLGLIGKGSAEYFLSVYDKNTLGFKLSAAGFKINGEDARKIPDKISTDVIMFGAGITYTNIFYDKLMPYASLTLNKLWFSPKDENGKRAPNNAKNKYSREGMLTSLEVGLRYRYDDYFTFNFNTSLNYPDNDNIDDFSSGKSKDMFLSVGLGASIALFGKGDTDKDGILNSIDKCPNEPEDFDGFEDSDGCPDFDNDNDGIKDTQDKCPDKSEDIDGFEDLDGCPEDDNDKDGILDANDKCPNEPEDVDGFEDEDGCPDLDNDYDGIKDADDKCPNEPETFNNYEDKDGCPDEVPVVKDTVKTVVVPVIPAVPAVQPKQEKPVAETKPLRKAPDEFVIHSATTFRMNSSTIESDARPYLNNIADTLKKYPGERWRIEGHIDSKTASSNESGLSAKMAKAIQDYLVGRGIPASRFVLADMLDRFPIASNTTSFGRMKNRRVVLVRVK